jgi:hypothetical protein
MVRYLSRLPVTSDLQRNQLSIVLLSDYMGYDFGVAETNEHNWLTP